MFGITNPLVLLGLAVAFLVALGTIIYKIDHNGYLRGQNECQAAFAKRDNTALRQALADLELATTKVRALEKKSVDDQSNVGQRLQKEIKNVETKKDAVIADLKSGNLRLFVELASSSSNGAASPAGKVSPGGQQGDGTKAGELLGEADSTFLVNEASRADAIVVQLTAAQEALKADREVCK